MYAALKPGKMLEQILPEYSFATPTARLDIAIGRSAPPMPTLNGLNTYSQHRKVLGKGIPETVRVGHSIVDGTVGMTAHQGIARKQRKGLASDRKLNAPLMKGVSSDFGYRNSKIAMPR